MSEFKHALEKLEFDKVRERVSRYAASEVGRELIDQMTVMTSAEAIRGELSRVTEFKRLLEEEESFPLEGIYPVRASIQKAAVEGVMLSGRDLAQVASTARAARNLRAYVAKRRESYPLLWSDCESLYVDKVLEYNIEQAIDDTGAVRASASKELQTIRRTISEKYDQLRKRLETIQKGVSELGFTQEEIITTREGRMVIPVKSEHKNRVPGFIHSASASGATVFIEPTETLELNNEIRSLQFQEQREVERILMMLTQQVGERRDELLSSLEILACVDVLHAKVKYSIELLGAEPQVSPSGPIRLVQARHPILILTHGYKATVPSDIDLGGSYQTLVISGPNAGGKSVALKCVGLLSLMVQCGLHIPASDQSTVRVFQRFFVDIGDEQSIENDLSTFSSHLRNLKDIDQHADADSLVLIDEIGSGTDPAEGGAIAAALLESLTKRGTYTVATTHHSALKVFAYGTTGVENGAMEFDSQTLTPTYRFKAGIPGSSYALEMASRLGFQDLLLKRAREQLGAQASKVEMLIVELETSAQRLQRENEILQLEKARLDQLVKMYEARTASLDKEIKDVKRKALEEAKRIVEDANALIERSVQEIRERSADRKTVREVHENVQRLKRHLIQKQDEVAPEPVVIAEKFEPGSLVHVVSGTEVGEIESLPPDGKTAVVVFGSVRMKVALSELRPAKGTGSSPRSFAAIGSEKPQIIQQDIDLRGMTGEEAIPVVDKLIDQATLAGLHRIDLIHGKGTGALRKKITDFLSHHPRVRSFRLGEWNEGGTGATVVELVDS